MNLVECIWGYLKHHAMPNYCATNFTDLAQRVGRCQTGYDICDLQEEETEQ